MPIYNPAAMQHALMKTQTSSSPAQSCSLLGGWSEVTGCCTQWGRLPVSRELRKKSTVQASVVMYACPCKCGLTFSYEHDSDLIGEGLKRAGSRLSGSWYVRALRVAKHGCAQWLDHGTTRPDGLELDVACIRVATKGVTNCRSYPWKVLN